MPAELTQVGIRFPPEEIEALRLAAKRDLRPLNTVARIAVREWLIKHGFLKEAAPAEG